jgi:stearoyl-CoA desaturase (delta-9 desaturase)
MGEGWHNNHHHYQSSVRQSHRWYEIDCSFYIIKAMSWLGLVWDLKPVPAKLWSPRSVTAAEAGTEALPIPSAI